MTTYSFAQLEELWINAGGSRTVAPVMAAIALAESSGISDNNNYHDSNGRGGSQTSWGLWQISDGTHNQPVPNIDDPQVNAREAVAKYNASGFGPWGTYPQPALSILSQHGGTAPATGALPPGGSAGGSAGGSQSATLTSSPVGDILDALQSVGALIHGAAQGLNFVFEFFQPGQMWRVASAGVAVGMGYVAARLYAAPGSDSRLPLIFLTSGVTLGAAYMALRPWPQSTSGGSIRPGAYAVDIFKGHPPQGTPPVDETAGIEAGLYAIVGIWIISKTAEVINDAGNLITDLGSLFGWVGGLFALSKSSGESKVQLESAPSLPFGANPQSGTTLLLWQTLSAQLPAGPRSGARAGGPRFTMR